MIRCSFFSLEVGYLIKNTSNCDAVYFHGAVAGQGVAKMPMQRNVGSGQHATYMKFKRFLVFNA